MNNQYSSKRSAQILMLLALGAAGTAATAAPVTIKYLFDNAAGVSYANPGLDSSLSLPAALSNFTPWSDTDGTLIQATPIDAADGLDGPGRIGRAVAARSWHDGNAFNFSFDVAAGSVLSLSQISFFEQGSNGAQGLGPTSWTLSINGNQVGSDVAFRGNPGATRTLSVGLPGNLTGTIAFSIFATGAANSGATLAANATWRIDNFTLNGDLTAVPLPPTLALLASALAGLTGLRRRAS